MHLFAVYLGGRIARCNTELHDVVFVTGETIEAVYEQCLDLWFGAVSRLHLDSFMSLDVVDGHRVTLSKKPPAQDKTTGGKALYFINLGGYADGQFTELHANMIVVAASANAAKARAKGELMQGGESEVHTDDLYDVDDCLEVSSVGPWHVHLAPTDERTAPVPRNGYHIIPQAVIDDYVARHPERA